MGGRNHRANWTHEPEWSTRHSEVLPFRAQDRAAEATVIESKLDKGRGTVATVLVQKGTLKRGDIVVYESTVYPGVTEDEVRGIFVR